ncbi:hypothetical protein FBULB1_9078 [Fusarium bulbicola]|nr:hypothetical protein FBULB1_9078 [Fusarium bulbicola]
MAAPREECVPYCACTMRRLNLDGTLTNMICDLCNRHFPDDKTIYMVLKDDVKHLRLLECKRMTKRKNTNTTNDKGAIMDAIDSLAYREDIHSLFTSLENPLPAAEPEKVADEEVVWVTELKPATEEILACDSPCDTEAAVEEDQGRRNTEPEAPDEEYVCVSAMEKPCDDDGDNSASDKPGGPEVEPPTMKEADLAEVCKVPVEDTKSSDEKAMEEEHAQEKKDLIYLPFGSQYNLVVQLQGILERACFAYAEKRLPALLYKHGWSCAEAVPLHTWIDQLTVTQFALNTERSRELLESVADIEDTAVKRIPIDWYKTAEFLDNAAKLTEVLQTKEHSDYIKRIRVDIEVVIRDLRDQEQKAQEDERLERLQILSEQERLRYKEWLVKKEKERKIRECRHSAGLKVMRALGKDKRDEF